MALSWTRDPIVAETMFVEDQDFEEVYTNLNTLRALVSLSALSVPELNAIITTKAQSDAIRTALTDFEAVANGTAYMVHNGSKVISDTCSSHDSTHMTTHNVTYNSTANTGVSCAGHYASANSSYYSSNDGSVYSN